MVQAFCGGWGSRLGLRERYTLKKVKLEKTMSVLTHINAKRSAGECCMLEKKAWLRDKKSPGAGDMSKMTKKPMRNPEGGGPGPLLYAKMKLHL